MKDKLQPANPDAVQYPARVLLVDDQAMIGEAVRRSMAGENDILFHYCGDPAKAIDLAREWKPTVILQDLVMPQMNGLDLVAAFRADEDLRETPIIVLSTKEEPQVKSDAFAIGANDYLVKLPARLELLARVRYHTKAHCNRLERDEAYAALRLSEVRLIGMNESLVAANRALSDALAQVQQLQGLLPICCCCKKVRNDGNYWQQIEAYICEHTGTQFSHTYCDECFEREMAQLKNSKPAGESPAMEGIASI